MEKFFQVEAKKKGLHLEFVSDFKFSSQKFGDL